MKNQKIKLKLDETILIVKNKFNEVKELKPNNKIIDVFEKIILLLEKEGIRLDNGKNN